MIFTTKKQDIVQRAGIGSVFKLNVPIESYRELILDTKSYSECVYEFYNLLKKQNRIINCPMNLIGAEIISAVSRLLSENLQRADKIIFLGDDTKEKFWDTIGDSPISNWLKTYEQEVIEKHGDKKFVIITYSDKDNIGLNYRFNIESRSYELYEPVYQDHRYNSSHYNYFYGMKIND